MVGVYFRQHDLLADILSISPFNIIFGNLNMMNPMYLVVPLRLLRVFSMFKIPELLNKIEFELIQVSNYITVVKTMYFLIYLWHFSSCMWFFINLHVEDEDTYKWLNYNKLEHETLAT
jgi:hypothetical protein